MYFTKCTVFQTQVLVVICYTRVVVSVYWDMFCPAHIISSLPISVTRHHRDSVVVTCSNSDAFSAYPDMFRPASIIFVLSLSVKCYCSHSLLFSIHYLLAASFCQITVEMCSLLCLSLLAVKHLKHTETCSLLAVPFSHKLPLRWYYILYPLSLCCPFLPNVIAVFFTHPSLLLNISLL